MAITGLTKGDAPGTRAVARRSSQQIYDEIRRRICLLTYPPGMLLKETELALEFGVSRTPIRDVLHQLKFEGLVETRNGVGTFVTSVDFKSFTDAYDLRIEMAEMIGRLSPHPVEEEHVAAIEGLMLRAKKLQTSRDAEIFWQIHHDLQELINGLIGNQELARLNELYYYKVSRFWYQLAGGDWDREINMLRNELGELLEAARSGDVKAVANIRRNHISFVKIRIGEFIAKGRA
jgi:DNA-binding GntR family transcriptional regulator